MNDIYVFRAVPYEQDSRTVRYKKLLKGNVIFNCWEDNYINKKGLERLKLGKKRFSKILVYPCYLLYLFFFTLFKVKKGSIVICMDLDTFIPIFLGNILKRNIIIFDIVDPISQTRFSTFPCNRLFDLIELLIIKYRGGVFLPLKNRVQFYLDRLGLNWDVSEENFIVLENVPEFILCANIPEQFERKYDDGSLVKIGYFGTLDNSRGLMELIRFVKSFPKYELILSGRGNLVPEIKWQSEQFDNIKYLGAYHPDSIELLYNQVDFVWAFYSPEIFLHHYAAPNKFYEHLAFKTPIICNECIPQSTLIRHNSSGIVISDFLDENCMSSLDRKIRDFSCTENSFSLWEEKYASYYKTLRDYNDKYDIFK